MNKQRKKTLLAIIGLFILICAAGVGTAYYYFLYPQFHPKEKVYIYIDRDDTTDSIYNKVKQAGNVSNFSGFEWMAKYRKFDKNIHTGRYMIRPGDNVYHLFSRLSRGYQAPINLTIGSVRTLDRLARSIGKQLMVDSAEIARQLFDSTFQQKLGYTSETLACFFIPDTYEVYWDMSVDELFDRMQKEHKKFWNDNRLAKAQSMGMTPEEVCTLASIVEEETNNNGEKPLIAGMYINRLHTNYRRFR